MNLSIIPGYIRQYRYLYDYVVEVEDPTVYFTASSIINTLSKQNKIVIHVKADRKMRYLSEPFTDLQKSSHHYHVNQELRNITVYGKKYTEKEKLDILRDTGYLMLQRQAIKSRVSRAIFDRVSFLSPTIAEYRRCFKERLSKRKYEPFLFTALGGAKEIGRSAYLFRTFTQKIIIDMGLGFGEANKHPFLTIPEVGDLSTIDAIVITHPHLDHSGSLPFLVRAGYKNPIYMTESCLKANYISFKDVYKLHGGSYGIDAQDLDNLIKQTFCRPFGTYFKVSPGISIKFKHSNHVLGGAAVELDYLGKRWFFTSDFNWNTQSLLKPMHLNPNTVYEALITEGTNILKLEPLAHKKLIAEDHAKIQAILTNAYMRQTTVLFPTLLLGRSLEVLVLLCKFFTADPVLITTIYITRSVLDVWKLHLQHAYELRQEGKIALETALNTDFIKVILPENQNKPLSGYNIIIAPSGMLEGGAAVKYALAMLPKEGMQITFTCYQPPESTGASVLNTTAGDVIRVVYRGVEHIVEKTCETHALRHAFSGHASRSNLLHFLKLIKAKQIYVVHSTPNLQTINKFSKFRWPAVLETYRLY